MCHPFSLNLQKHKEQTMDKIIMAENSTSLNEAQLRMLNVVAKLGDTVALDGLRKVVCDYLDSQLQAEMNRLWDDGKLDDQKIESFRALHERTPYRTHTLNIG